MKRLLVFALLCVMQPAHAADIYLALPSKEDKPVMSIQSGSAKSSALTIQFGKTHVTIKHDGSIEYGEGYDPDEAARVFWSAIGRNMPNKECK